ncbi:5417_t:CDS:2 [Entrophospora sp. SA101]|nr:5417_t:CDS:2 [Entrophospora sp. SA101]
MKIAARKFISPLSSLSSVYYEDKNKLIKAQLNRIHFWSRNSSSLPAPLPQLQSSSSSSKSALSGNNQLTASSFSDIGLLFRYDSQQISICIHKMREEIVIPFSEIVECRFIDERQMMMSLRPSFVRRCYTHSTKYPYKKEPKTLNHNEALSSIRMTINDYFSNVEYLLIKTYHKLELEVFNEPLKPMILNNSTTKSLSIKI